MAAIDTAERSRDAEDAGYHQPRSVEELTEQNVETVRRLEVAAQKQRSAVERLAGAVGDFCGTGFFLAVHVLWFAAWLLYNGLAGERAFDPYPFTFLTLVVSLEAIFLSTFILISQKHSARLDDQRNQLDLQINLLSEQETTKILSILEKVARQVGVNDDDAPTLRILEQATRPETLVEQIERSRDSSTSP